MCLTKRAGFLTGAIALTLTGSSFADSVANTADDAELRARLAAAEARLAELESTDSDNWLTEQRSEEIRGIVHDVLADADMRASLLGAGITAGYDDGAVIGSSDGNWLLRTNVLIQARGIYNNQDTSTFDDDDRHGFETTRAKVIWTGHVVDPSWYYRLDFNFGSGGSGEGMFDGGFPEDDVEGTDRQGTGNAYIGREFGNGWYLQSGTQKLPLLREELVESQYQQTVERSVLNYAFTGGYSDGMSLGYDGDSWRMRAMLSDGVQQNGTIWSSVDTDYALTGRAEFLLSGNWDQFDDFTSPEGDEQGTMVGVAGHYQAGEDDTSKNGNDYWMITGDLSMEFGGANIFASLVYSDVDPSGGSGTNPWGFTVQGAWYLNADWELFARFEYADFDSTSSSVDDLSIVTVGVNRYFAGHHAKWTADFGYAFDSLDASEGPTGYSPTGMNGFPANITGWRPDLDDEDGQLVIRTQLQILF